MKAPNGMILPMCILIGCALLSGAILYHAHVTSAGLDAIANTVYTSSLDDGSALSAYSSIKLAIDNGFNALIEAIQALR